MDPVEQMEAKATSRTLSEQRPFTDREKEDAARAAMMLKVPAQREFSSSLFSLSDDSIGAHLVENVASGRMSNTEVFALQDAMNEETRNMLGRAAISPATVAPDILGIAAQFINWSTGVVSQHRYGDDSGQTRLPVLSGNPLREAFGLDLNSVSGAMGEIFGGWENLAVKGGTLGLKAFEAAMSSDPSIVLSGFFGIKGVTTLGDAKALYNHGDAVARLAKGENPATVMKDTRWYRDKADGQMKIAFSDSEIKVDGELIQALADNAVLDAKGRGRISTTIGEALVGEAKLLEAYPQLRNMPVNFSITRHPNGKVIIFNDAKDLKGVKASTSLGKNAEIEVYNAGADLGRSSLLHEIQHQIQVIEGFGRGSNGAVWKQAIARLKSNDMERATLKAIQRGDIKDGDIESTIVPILRKILKEQGSEVAPSPEDISFAKRWAIQDITAIDEELGLMGSRLDADSRTVGTMLNELGEESSDEAIQRFLNQNYEIINGAVLTRYKNQGGEVEARIVQLLEDWTQKEIDALDTPLSELSHLVGTPAERVVGSNANLPNELPAPATNRMFKGTSPEFAKVIDDTVQYEDVLRQRRTNLAGWKKQLERTEPDTASHFMARNHVRNIEREIAALEDAGEVPFTFYAAKESDGAQYFADQFKDGVVRKVDVEASNLATVEDVKALKNKDGSPLNPHRTHSVSNLTMEEVVALKKAGFDGATGPIDNIGSGGDEVVVFNPKQVKFLDEAKVADNALEKTFTSNIIEGNFPTELDRLFAEMDNLEGQLEGQIPFNKLLRTLVREADDRPFPKLESIEKRAAFTKLRTEAEAEIASNKEIIDNYIFNLEDAMRLEMDKTGIPERIQEDIIEGIIPRPKAGSMKMEIIKDYQARIKAHYAADNGEAAARLESEMIDLLQSMEGK